MVKKRLWRVLEKVEYKINKNFNQMDLENVQIKETVEGHVRNMLNKCTITNKIVKCQEFE